MAHRCQDTLTLKSRFNTHKSNCPAKSLAAQLNEFYRQRSRRLSWSARCRSNASAPDRMLFIIGSPVETSKDAFPVNFRVGDEPDGRWTKARFPLLIPVKLLEAF